MAASACISPREPKSEIASSKRADIASRLSSRQRPVGWWGLGFSSVLVTGCVNHPGRSWRLWGLYQTRRDSSRAQARSWQRHKSHTEAYSGYTLMRDIGGCGPYLTRRPVSLRDLPARPTRLDTGSTRRGSWAIPAMGIEVRERELRSIRGRRDSSIVGAGGGHCRPCGRDTAGRHQNTWLGRPGTSMCSCTVR